MAFVVRDTSPILALAFLNLMELLRELYSDVLIPPAVHRELSKPLSEWIVVGVDDFPFIKVQAPSDRERVARFASLLDQGESEALALALEVGADLILMDELEGRAVAVENGLIPIGVLGILLKAKERGLVGPIGPSIDRLRDELGFFISTSLRAKILGLAGELLT